MATSLQLPSFETMQGTVRPRTYLRWLLLLSVVLYLLPFALIRLPGFERWCGGNLTPALNFAYEPPKTNADVVIFGDSTAFFDLDPNQMSRELGRSVLNLPGTIGTLHVDGDMSLRRYLARHAAPKIILIFVAPYNLDYAHDEGETADFEGEELMLHNGSAAELVAFARRDPEALLVFPFRIYLSNLKPSINAARKHLNRTAEAANKGGHLDGEGLALVSPCVLPKKLAEPVPMDDVKALASHYTTPITKAVIVLAPVPDCSGRTAIVDRSYAELHAAAPLVMPAPLFRRDHYYVHLLAASVPVETRRIVEQLRPLFH